MRRPSPSAWTAPCRSWSSTSWSAATSGASSPAARAWVPWSSDAGWRDGAMSDLTDMVLADTGDKMQKAVEHAQAEFSSVRTGRASPAFVEKLAVDYYGSEVPLQQIAGFSVPE